MVGDEHALQLRLQDSTVRTIFSETSVWNPVLNCLTVVFYYLPIFILAAFCTWAVIPFNLENFPSHSVEPFFHSNICEQFGLQVADFIAKFLISDCPVLECSLFQVSEASEGGMDSVEAALDEVPLSDLESRETKRYQFPHCIFLTNKVLRRLRGGNAQFMEEVCK